MSNSSQDQRDQREYHRNRYARTREAQLEYQRVYLQNSAVQARRSEKEPCVCGAIISKRHMKNHLETRIHKLFLENPEEHKKYIDQLKKEKKENPKYKCHCGSEMKNQASVIAKHKKSDKHLKWEKPQ